MKTFEEHLEYASNIVSKWPEWKQNLLGGIRVAPIRIITNACDFLTTDSYGNGNGWGNNNGYGDGYRGESTGDGCSSCYIDGNADTANGDSRDIDEAN